MEKLARFKNFFTRKRILIILLAVIVVLVAVTFLVSANKSGKKLDLKIENKEESHVIKGNTYACKPTPDGHQYYRTDKTLVVDPINPDTLYVNIEHVGFLKSVDGGKSWDLKTKGIKTYGREDDPKKGCHGEYPTTTIDPKDPKHVILGLSGTPTTFKEGYTKAGGMVQSFDGGESWEQMLADWMNLYVTDIAIDPKDSKKIFYSTTTGPSSFTEADKNKMFVSKGVIYKSVDGGASWEELSTGLLPYMSASKIFFDPADSAKMISFTFTAGPVAPGEGRDTGGVEQMGLLRSNDGGNTWTKTLPFLDGYNSTIEAEQSPKNGNNLYVAPAAPLGANPKAFYSSDFGATWSQAGKYIKISAYDPHDPTGQRIVGYSNVEKTPTNKITYMYESLDNGKSWNKLGTLPAEVLADEKEATTAISKIVFHPTEKNTFFMSGAGGLVWKTKDNGGSWETLLDYKKVINQ